MYERLAFLFFRLFSFQVYNSSTYKQYKLLLRVYISVVYLHFRAAIDSQIMNLIQHYTWV